jgi:hypothetical protein
MRSVTHTRHSAPSKKKKKIAAPSALLCKVVPLLNLGSLPIRNMGSSTLKLPAPAKKLSEIFIAVPAYIPRHIAHLSHRAAKKKTINSMNDIILRVMWKVILVRNP